MGHTDTKPNRKKLCECGSEVPEQWQTHGGWCCPQRACDRCRAAQAVREHRQRRTVRTSGEDTFADVALACRRFLAGQR